MLVTVEEVKTFLGIKNNTQNAVIEMLIGAMTSYIENHCQRKFEADDYIEKQDGTGNCELLLNQYPINSITRLERNQSLNNTESFVTVDAEEYFSAEKSGILTKITSFLRGKQNYKITYNAGYAEADVPEDLKYCCQVLISEAMGHRKNTGLKSESLGDHSVSFGASVQSNPVIKNILSGYRKIPIC